MSSRACSVTVSYKPPMLVTRVRLPACAYVLEAGIAAQYVYDCVCQIVFLTWLIQKEANAASEDRTHDLGIMRPTRYQLRYSRTVWISWRREWDFEQEKHVSACTKCLGGLRPDVYKFDKSSSRASPPLELNLLLPLIFEIWFLSFADGSLQKQCCNFDGLAVWSSGMILA